MVQSTIVGRPGWFGSNTTGNSQRIRGAITLYNVEANITGHPARASTTLPAIGMMWGKNGSTVMVLEVSR